MASIARHWDGRVGTAGREGEAQTLGWGSTRLRLCNRTAWSRARLPSKQTEGLEAKPHKTARRNQRC